jgi:DnaK suppressor protein
MTTLTAAERDALDALIAAERARTVTMLAALEAEFAGIVASASTANIDDEHDPEGSTIAFERAQVAALRQQAERDLIALDEARVRLASGTYATCGRCGGSIPYERLLAVPTTSRCVACAAIAPV